MDAMEVAKGGSERDVAGHHPRAVFQVSIRATALLVDDDNRLCALLKELLGRHNIVLHTHRTGEAALAQLFSPDHFDIVILDVMLPQADGFEILQRIRVHSRIPVLMLTAAGEDQDRIRGLELGADDYLGKPFNPRELLARIRAILRRVQPEPAIEVAPEIVVGDIAVDLRSRVVRVHGRTVSLTAAEFDLLAMLMQHPGEVLERREAFIGVLDRPSEFFDRSIDMHISRLRRKLGRLPDGGTRIACVRGVGYRLRWTKE